MKTHWKKLKNPDYLGSWDFQPGEEKTLTITGVSIKKVTAPGGKMSDCPVMEFKENVKPLATSSAANAMAMKFITGSNYIEDWPGHKVRLFVLPNVKAFGSIVDAVRIRSMIVKDKPELTPNHQKWNEVKAKVQAKEVTFETIRKHYSLSTQNEKLLQS